MAQKRSITYEINYQNNQQSLAKTISELERIKTSTRIELGLGGISDANFAKAKAAADKLSSALSKSFDYDLGVTNVAKFREEIQKTGSSLDSLYADLKKVAPEGTEAFRDMAASIATSNIQLQKTTGFLDKMATTFMNTIRWSIATTALNGITEGLSSAVSFVEKLDTSLNNIRVVTGASADDMDRFAKEANKAAIELGASTRDIAEGALIFYQQGDTDADAMYKAQVTQKLTNVSTDLNAEEASEFMTAIWNGFQVNKRAAQEGMQVYDEYADKLAAVAASTASDVTEQATAMAKVASVANQVGIGFDQLNAIMATTESVTRQAPESIGTAWRTIVSRISDLKLSGVDEEGVTLGDVSGQLSGYGINILDEETGELREIGKVIDEIGQKWDTWTVAQQNAVAQLIAGKRQYNYVTALFQEWNGMYQTALDTSETGVGKLQEMQNIYKESNTAIRQQFKTTQEALYSDLFDVDTVNEFYKALTGIFTVVDNIVKSLGGGMPIFLWLAGLFTQVISGKLAAGLGGVVNNIKSAQLQAQNAKEALQLTQQLRTIDDENTKEIISYIDKFANKQRFMNEDQRALLQTLVQEKVEIQNLDRELNDLSVTASNTYSKLFDEKLSFEGLDARGTRAIAKSNVDEYIKNISTARQILDTGFRGSLDSLFEINNNSAFVEAGEKVQDLYNKIYAGTDSAQVKLVQFRNELINQQEEAEKLSKSLQNLDIRYQSNSNHSDQVAAKTKNLSAQMESAVKIEPWIQAVSAVGMLTSGIITLSDSFERLTSSETSFIEKLQAISSLTFSFMPIVSGLKQLNSLTGGSGFLSDLFKNYQGAQQLRELKPQQTSLEMQRAEELDKIRNLKIEIGNKDILIAENTTKLNAVTEDRIKLEQQEIALKQQIKAIDTAIMELNLGKEKYQSRIDAVNRELELENKKLTLMQQEVKIAITQEKDQEKKIQIYSNFREKESEILNRILVLNFRKAQYEEKYGKAIIYSNQKIKELDNQRAVLITNRNALQSQLNAKLEEENELTQKGNQLNSERTDLVNNLNQIQGGLSQITSQLTTVDSQIAQIGNVGTTVIQMITAAINKNPIELIISAIGLLVVAFNYLNTAQERAEEHYEKLQEKLEKVKSELDECVNKQKEFTNQIKELRDLEESVGLTSAQKEELNNLEQRLEKEKQITEEKRRQYEIDQAATIEAAIKAAQTQKIFKGTKYDYLSNTVDALYENVNDEGKPLIEGIIDTDEERAIVSQWMDDINKGVTDLQEVRNTLTDDLGHYYKQVPKSLSDSIEEALAKAQKVQEEYYNVSENSLEDFENKWTITWGSLSNSTIKRLQELKNTGALTLNNIKNTLKFEDFNTLLESQGGNENDLIIRLQQELSGLDGSLEKTKKEVYATMQSIDSSVDMTTDEFAEFFNITNTEKKPFEGLIGSAEEYGKILQKLKGDIKAVESAMTEQNKQGYISADTALDLISKNGEYAKALEVTNNGFKINTESLKTLLAAEVNVAIQEYDDIIRKYDLAKAVLTNSKALLQEAKSKDASRLADLRTDTEEQEKWLKELGISSPKLALAIRNYIAHGEEGLNTFIKAEVADSKSPITEDNQFEYLGYARNYLTYYNQWLDKNFTSTETDKIEAKIDEAQATVDSIGEKGYDLAVDAKKNLEKVKQSILDGTAFSTSSSSYKADKYSKKVRDIFNEQIKAQEALIVDLEKQYSDYDKRITEAIADKDYDLAMDLITEKQQVGNTLKSKYAELAASWREINEQFYQSFLESNSDIIKQFNEGKDAELQITDVKSFSRNIESIKSLIEQKYEDLQNRLQDDSLSDAVKDSLNEQIAELDRQKNADLQLLSNMSEIFTQAGAKEGEGKLAEEYWKIDKEDARKAASQVISIIQAEDVELLDQLADERKELSNAISNLDSIAYSSKQQYLLEDAALAADQVEIYRKELERLEETAERLGLSDEEVAEAQRKLNDQLRDAEQVAIKANKAIEDYAKSVEDAVINQEKSAADAWDKAMQNQFDDTEKQIDAEQRLLDKRKDAIDEAKKALDKYLKALEKLWNTEDKHDERRKKLEERAEIARERATQLTAAASGDLSALANIKDLNEQLKETDEELQQDIIEDIRDSFKQYIEDIENKWDEELDKADKVIKLQEKALDEDKRRWDEFKKTAEYWMGAMTLSSGGAVEFNGKWLTYRDFLTLNQEHEGLSGTAQGEKELREAAQTFEGLKDAWYSGDNADNLTKIIQNGISSIINETTLKLNNGENIVLDYNGTESFNRNPVTTSSGNKSPFILSSIGTAAISTGIETSKLVTKKSSLTDTPMLTYDFSSFMAGLSDKMISMAEEYNRGVASLTSAIVTQTPNVNITAPLMNIEGDVDDDTWAKIQSIWPQLTNKLFSEIKQRTAANGVV